MLSFLAYFLVAVSNFPAQAMTRSKLGEACHLRFRRGTNSPKLYTQL